MATLDTSLDEVATDRRQEEAPSDRGCSRCGNAESSIAPSFVYAIGRIEPRFPQVSIEKEFAQATARTATTGKADREVFHTVLSQREHRYLVRQLCWVMSIQGLDTYLLVPRNPADLDLLLEAIRPSPSPLDLDVILGTKGDIAPPSFCNGLMLPVVTVDQVYSFGREALLEAIPRPPKTTREKFKPVAEEVLDRLLQLADNAGNSDEHRAVNYLAMRYPAIYTAAADQHARDCALTSVEVRPSRLSGARRIADVVWTFNHRKTDVADRWFVRVDVTEEFPFLVSKLAPFYER